MTNAQLALLLATLWAISIRGQRGDNIIRVLATLMWTFMYFLEHNRP